MLSVGKYLVVTGKQSVFGLGFFKRVGPSCAWSNPEFKWNPDDRQHTKVLFAD